VGNNKNNTEDIRRWRYGYHHFITPKAAWHTCRRWSKLLWIWRCSSTSVVDISLLYRIDRGTYSERTASSFTQHNTSQSILPTICAHNCL